MTKEIEFGFITCHYIS